MSKLVRNLKGVQILRRAKQEALPYTVAVGQIVNSPDKTILTKSRNKVYNKYNGSKGLFSILLILRFF